MKVGQNTALADPHVDLPRRRWLALTHADPNPTIPTGDNKREHRRINPRRHPCALIDTSQDN